MISSSCQAIERTTVGPFKRLVLFKYRGFETSVGILVKWGKFQANVSMTRLYIYFCTKFGCKVFQKPPYILLNRCEPRGVLTPPWTSSFSKYFRRYLFQDDGLANHWIDSFYSKIPTHDLRYSNFLQLTFITLYKKTRSDVILFNRNAR